MEPKMFWPTTRQHLPLLATQLLIFLFFLKEKTNKESVTALAHQTKSTFLLFETSSIGIPVEK
jgi:hypothetical protein